MFARIQITKLLAVTSVPSVISTRSRDYLVHTTGEGHLFIFLLLHDASIPNVTAGLSPRKCYGRHCCSSRNWTSTSGNRGSLEQVFELWKSWAYAFISGQWADNRWSLPKTPVVNNRRPGSGLTFLPCKVVHNFICGNVQFFVHRSAQLCIFWPLYLVSLLSSCKLNFEKKL